MGKKNFCLQHTYTVSNHLIHHILQFDDHFKMIQNIATDKQKEKFKTILMDALRQGDQGNRPPPNGEDGRRPPPRGGSEGHRPPPRKD